MYVSASQSVRAHLFLIIEGLTPWLMPHLPHLWKPHSVLYASVRSIVPVPAVYVAKAIPPLWKAEPYSIVCAYITYCLHLPADGHLS